MNGFGIAEDAAVPLMRRGSNALDVMIAVGNFGSDVNLAA
jgi:hypothetical protein